MVEKIAVTCESGYSRSIQRKINEIIVDLNKLTINRSHVFEVPTEVVLNLSLTESEISWIKFALAFIREQGGNEVFEKIKKKVQKQL